MSDVDYIISDINFKFDNFGAPQIVQICYEITVC